MEDTDFKIGLTEIIALIILIIGTKLTVDIPVIIYEVLFNAAWMMPLINGILAFIPFYFLFITITHYKHQNLLDTITDLYGKYLGHITLVILWALLFVHIAMETAVYTNILETMYFSRTPTIAIYSTLIIVSAYGARKGIESISSTAFLSIIFIKISLLFALLVSLTKSNMNFLFPLFGPGIFGVLKESTLKLSIFADLFFISILIPYMKKTADFKKGTVIALIIIAFEFSFSLAAFVMLFDFHKVTLINYPFHELIRSIHLGFLTNMEILFLPFWLIASFIRFALYIYILTIIFSYIVKIKQYRYTIPITATLIMLVGLIPSSPSFSLFSYREAFSLVTTVIYVFIPVSLWSIAKLRGDFT